ncbi:MAG: hypothetical protein HOP12_06190 [Candidatus Eisenbacteria bacterium]|uniref:Uncharacterized protein n=1 Tax=Eiseniibacteriota bacterium TaxID=2212470 RepID=A0A849SP85_UNCEI|nr:hypothetical protein [Candidatus Eisenbacteria bacterium]
MRVEFGRADRVRAIAGEERLTLRNARVEASGVRYDEAFSRGPLGSRKPGLLAWSDIDRVEVGQTRMGRYAVLGAIGAAAVSGIWVLTAHPPRSDAGFLTWGVTSEGKSVGLVVLSAFAGAALGAGVGHASARWHDVYPEREPSPVGARR